MSRLDRERVFANRSLVGTVFCRSYSRHVDEWLADAWDERIASGEGASLVATGGYGRSTLSPQSDIDLMLLHSGYPEDDLADMAQKIWYPIWDEGLKLGHSVRTVKESMALARTDIDTATSLIHGRHIAGDADLTARLVDAAQHQWRKGAATWLPVLASAAAERERSHGEVAFLLEPDLKLGAGGLRDVHAVQWAEAAGLELLEHERRELRDAHEVILAARIELHRATGRLGDRLLLEEQDAVAEALGIADADVMMKDIAASARRISWIARDVWNRIEDRTWRSRLLRRRGRAKPVSETLQISGSTLSLSDGARPARQPLLVLELAVEAARRRVRFDRATLDRLGAGAAALPTPWPDEARKLFVELLATGADAIPVIETLDFVDLFVPLVPEWEPTRNKPQRNRYHMFTVDRHLLETAANAADHVEEVDRPDLLLVGALLHDIGKGYPGDHTVVGQDLIRTIAARMGFPEPDIDLLELMVEHHLLLPDVATRRDIEDEDTIRSVADQVGSVRALRLLTGLTVADSMATGPSAWSAWKAGLVRDLVRRTEAHLAGGSFDDPTNAFPTDDQRALLRTREHVIRGEGNTLTIIVPDRQGVFSLVAGAIALNGLDVVQAAIHSEFEMALQVFEVETRFGDVDWNAVRDSIHQVLAGEIELSSALDQRADRYAADVVTSGPEPVVATSVTFDNETSTVATVIEVAAPDSIGLLHRVTAAMTAAGLDIFQARAQTLGDHVVDSFYVRDGAGAKVVDQDRLDVLERALLQVV